MADKADASGQLFRRNRYYDPASGRFTQEDPIGLAGGLNAYGFAGGDPVNFSDPFGLCPEGLSDKDVFLCNWIEAGLVVLGADIGGTIGGGSGLTLAIASGGILVPAVPVGAIGGAAIGAIGGKLAGEYLTDRLFNKNSGRSWQRREGGSARQDSRQR
jgi:RHS repeat-associated protein